MTDLSNVRDSIMFHDERDRLYKAISYIDEGKIASAGFALGQAYQMNNKVNVWYPLEYLNDSKVGSAAAMIQDAIRDLEMNGKLGEKVTTYSS